MKPDHADEAGQVAMDRPTETARRTVLEERGDFG